MFKIRNWFYYKVDHAFHCNPWYVKKENLELGKKNEIEFKYKMKSDEITENKVWDIKYDRIINLFISLSVQRYQYITHHIVYNIEYWILIHESFLW